MEEIYNMSGETTTHKLFCVCSWCTSEDKIHFNDLDELVHYINVRKTNMNDSDASLFAIRMTTIKLYRIKSTN